MILGRIIKLTIGLLIVGAVLFLVDAFAGICTQTRGICVNKHIVQSADGKNFYRIVVKQNLDVLEVQSQSWDYDSINIGDSVYFTIRQGLFTNSIIERYNAIKK